MGTQLKLKGNSNGNGGYTTLEAGSAEGGEDIISTLPSTGGILLNNASPLNSQKLTGNLPALNGSALTNLPIQPHHGVLVHQIKNIGNTAINGHTNGSVDIWYTMWDNIHFTPISATSKILIQTNIYWSGHAMTQGQLLHESAGGDTVIAWGNVQYGTYLYSVTQANYSVVHEPGSTEQQTYKFQAQNCYNSHASTLWFNRSYGEYPGDSVTTGNTPAHSSYKSEITFIEYED